jgi:hypothetical protein
LVRSHHWYPAEPIQPCSSRSDPVMPGCSELEFWLESQPIRQAATTNAEITNFFTEHLLNLEIIVNK